MSVRDSNGRGAGSRPLCAIIPFRDGARYAALSGDGKPGDIVTEQSPYDVGRYCAALMAAVPASQRREAVRYMMTRISELHGDALPVVPIAPFLPEGATIEQDNKIVNGLHLMLLALGSAPGDASVGTVTANAAAMAAGVPYASDPMVGERQNEVILAKSILEAALLGDEEAKKWFADNGLRPALEHMVTYSAAGGTDQLPIQQSAQARLYQIYDCMQHDLPLGGSPVTKDLWRDLWNGAKTAVGNALLKSANTNDKVAADAGKNGKPTVTVRSGNFKRGGFIDKVKDADLKQTLASRGSDAGEDHDAVSDSLENSTEDRDNITSAGEAANGLKEEISKARAALEGAKSAMERGQENLATYRANLKDAALQSARLQWAQSLLDVPDDVASILSATTPNMSDVSTFLQSILSILPAAKETGSMSTLKSLLYAIRAATQSAGGDGSLYALLQGDPVPDSVREVITKDAPGWLRSINEARSRQADIAGSAAAEFLEKSPAEEVVAVTQPVSKAATSEALTDRAKADTSTAIAPTGVEGLVTTENNEREEV